MSLYNSVTYNIDTCFLNIEMNMYSSFSYIKSSETKSTIFINHPKNTLSAKGRHQIIFQYSGKLFDFDDYKANVGKVQLYSYNWYIFKIALAQYLENVVPRLFSNDISTPGMMFIDTEQYIALRKNEDQDNGILPRNLKTDEEYMDEMVFEFISQGKFESILSIVPIITEKEYSNEEYDNPETTSGYPAFAMYINHDSKCGITDFYGFRAFCEKIKEFNFDTIASNNTLMAMSKSKSYSNKSSTNSEKTATPSRAVTRKNVRGGSLKTNFTKDK